MNSLRDLPVVRTWPSEEVLEPVFSYPISLDGGGKELVDRLITDQGPRCVLLEVGVFLGASALRWLRVSDHCQVIGVDLWGEGWVKIIERYQQGSQPWMKLVLEPLGEKVEDLKESLITHGSLYCTLKNLTAFRDRFLPVQCDFKDCARSIAERVQPSIIYLDADKSETLIRMCAELFPEAVITGDDWRWGADQGYPVQKAVMGVCKEMGWSYEAERATWVIRR